MAKESILTISSTYSAGHNLNRFQGINEPNLMFEFIEQIKADLNNAIVFNPAKIFQFHTLRVGLNNFKENTQHINDLDKKNPIKDFIALDFQLEGLYPSGYRVLYHEGKNAFLNEHCKNIAQNIVNQMQVRYTSLGINYAGNAKGNSMGFVNMVTPVAFVVIVGRAGAVVDTNTLKDPIKRRFLSIGYILAMLDIFGLNGNYIIKENYKALFSAKTYQEFYSIYYPTPKAEPPKIEPPEIKPPEKKFKAFKADLINQELSRITTEFNENKKKFKTIKYFDEMIIFNKERMKIYKESLERLAAYSSQLSY